MKAVQGMRLSKRVNMLVPSATLAVTAKARAMRARGIDVISFGLGEPDFDTPEHIKDAAKRALDANWTHYMPTQGDPASREAIAKKLREENGLNVSADEVVITAGAKHAFYMAMHALIEPGRGDEVILPTPAWVGYAPVTTLAGGVIVEAPTSVESGFKLSPEQLRDALTPRTRVLVINSPNNPCGTMYSPAELEVLARVVNEHNAAGGDVVVVSDEIYEKLAFGDVPFASIARFLDDGRGLTINGLSKAYAMTGWRIAYAAGHRDLIVAIDKLQGQINTCLTAFCYPAIVEALEHGAADVERMREAYRRRGELAHGLLMEWPCDVRCPRPTGAFYLFPDVSCCFGKTTPAGRRVDGSVALAEAILEEARVAVVPGDDFGDAARNHIRISFACSEREIREGMARIATFIASLR